MPPALKIATVVGARPQFVKTAVVSRALRTCGNFDEVLIHTGQHYDANMSDSFFVELGIPEPTHHLGIGSASHGVQTGRMLIELERVFLHEKPDWVLIFGDTNSTVAAALAASKLHLRVAHVEAGLRSFNRQMPEELNRILSDHLSDCLFSPTEAATINLRREGIRESAIFEVGDVMYDAALHYRGEALARSRILESLGLVPKEFVLATIHRAENTDDIVRLGAIVKGLERVAQTIPVVFPLHPRTRAAMHAAGLAVDPNAQLRCVEPVGYLDMIRLENAAAVIATDSGGVQKEACFQGTPCVTLRMETEWMELVQKGCNRLCPPLDGETIAHTILGSRGTSWDALDDYGDGKAARRIAEALATI